MIRLAHAVCGPVKAGLAGLLLAFAIAGPASAAGTTELVTVSGKILDATPERMLYLTPGKRLLIRDIGSGQETEVPVRDGRTAYGVIGRLIDGGAIYASIVTGGCTCYAELDEWRDGKTTELGATMFPTSLVVAGDFAIFNDGHTLIRRQLSSGINLIVSRESGPGANDVSAGGDVVFWDTSYRVNRWRNGITTLISTAGSATRASYPLTDGSTVIFRRHDTLCCEGSIAFGSGGAETPLDGTLRTDHWPDAGQDYRINEGWLAYTRFDPTLRRRVWTRDPSGAYAPAGIDAETWFYDILGVAPDGHVMYSGETASAKAVYLAAPGTRPFRVPFPDAGGATDGFWAGGRWYIVSRAHDNVAGTFLRVELDTAATPPPPPITQDDDVSFALSSSARTATIHCRLDDADWADCGMQRAYDDIAEGVHVFQARATDTATGAVDATPATVTWRVDHTPPAPFGLIGPADGATLYLPDQPELRWEAATDTGSGVVAYRFKLDGVEHTLGPEQTSFAPSRDLDVGTHTWSVEAVDAAGNVRDGGSRTVTLAWDTTAPAAPALVAPPDATVTTDVTPTLTWEPATDAQSGMAFQTVLVDWSPVATLDPQVSTLTPELVEGTHTWVVWARDARDNHAESATRTIVIDLTAPVAVLAVNSSPALTGHAVSFDARASTDEHSRVVRHEWDLDGDGSFETDTGGAATATATYDTPGTRNVALRVTDAAGHVGTTAAPVDVRLEPLPGPPGVSINAGARFTNDPAVTITTRWPPFASVILVANDGGFAAAGTRPLAPTAEWTLDESGTERLPKTVYVRFPGSLNPDVTYQDDIILDQTAPEIAAATATPSGSRAHRIRLRAADHGSGIATVQVARDRRRPLRAVRWRRSLRVRGRVAPRWVRAADRAGNRSTWRRVARRR